MIDMARRQHAGLPAQFLHVSDGSPLPFDDASFDGGLSVWVLQYLKTTDHAQLYAVVAELARALSTGGELLLIEQASASGQASGSVSESSTEQDYLDVLGAWFDIESVLRIRCGRLSRLSALYSRYGNWLPFRHQIEDLLAWYETARAQHADAAFLQGMSYYDVAIRAVRRSST
jgi:SAM-dependent methyltransferase